MKDEGARRVPGLHPLPDVVPDADRRAAPTRKRSSTRTRRGWSSTTATSGYIRANVGEPELKVIEDSDDKKTRWVELRIPVTEGHALPGRRLRLRRQHGGQDRVPAAALQDEAGRVLQREADPQGAREGAGGLRRRRLLRVHGLSRTTSSTTTPTRTVPEAPEALKAPDAPGDQRRADRRRDDADAGGEAVLRQPHHVRRQHDHPRQRHPPRDAARRRTASSTPRR